MQIVGLAGSQIVRAYAVASSPTQSGQYCLMGVGTSGTNANDLGISGGGGVGNQTNIDLGGCDIFSNESDKCTGGGNNNKAGFGIGIGNYAGGAPNNNQACGTSSSKVSQIDYTTIANTALAGSPTYNSMTSNLPSNGCSSYHHSTDANFSSQSGNNLGSSGTSSTTVSTSGWSKTAAGIPYLQVCGDLSINSTKVTIDSSGAPVLLIVEDGGIYLNGHTLTQSGEGMTIVFQGTSGDKNVRSFQGSGTVDYSGPDKTTGSPFQGIALYYDTSNTTNLGGNSCPTTVSDLCYSGGGTGNGYNMDITGLIWDPLGNFYISGSINHATAGDACIGIVASTITVSGNGSIFPNPTSDCPTLGLPLPTTSASIRTSLVQ
jgi:hypothetical protein